LTNIDPKKEPKAINDDGKLIYEPCKILDFSLNIGKIHNFF
jgi:hypothetical protein